MKNEPVTELTTDEEYALQQPRLVAFFCTATALSFVQLLAGCSLLVAPHVHHLHAAMSIAGATLCFTASAVPMVLAWRPTFEAPPVQRVNRRRLNRLCAAVYLSFALLVTTPVGLLLHHSKANAFALAPLVPVVVNLFLLLRKGIQLGFAWGAAQYGAHDHDLRRAFSLAAGVTVPSYVGLLGHSVASLMDSSALRHLQLQDGVDAVECLLLYAVVAGLALMLLASSPPALYFRHTRAVLVNVFVGVLADVQLALVALAGLMAAAEIVGGFAVLALASNIAAACAMFAREHEDEPGHAGEHDVVKDGFSPRPLPVSAARVPLVTSFVALGVLLISSSSAAAGGRAFSWQEKTSVIAVASLLTGSLGQMALLRRAVGTDFAAAAVPLFG